MEPSRISDAMPVLLERDVFDVAGLEIRRPSLYRGAFSRIAEYPLSLEREPYR